MQTSILPKFVDTTIGQQGEAILRKCVHCGFCNATCPTYQLLGDELDGPRGRIYQIKQLLEGEPANANIELHLDRCLSCRSCETTCPSGVEYGKLLEIGRGVLNQQKQRNLPDRLTRQLIAFVVRSRRLFAGMLKLGRLIQTLLPAFISDGIPPAQSGRKMPWPAAVHPRKFVVLGGCVQPALAPSTNLAAAQVLDRLGISLVESAGAGCCGSVDLHTTTAAQAKISAKLLIDNWYPMLEQGVEGFIITASGCGVTIKEYPDLFQDDPDYLSRATAIAENSADLCEILDREIDAGFVVSDSSSTVAFHPPCTLQHGQKITGVVEGILERVGYTLVSIGDSQLCCGSAGTYSLLQPKISGELKNAKLENLSATAADVWCTANVGCQAHLNVNPDRPIKHWVELLL